VERQLRKGDIVIESENISELHKKQEDGRRVLKTRHDWLGRISEAFGCGHVFSL
jgi:hypothetical protein